MERGKKVEERKKGGGEKGRKEKRGESKPWSRSLSVSKPTVSEGEDSSH